MVLGQLPVPGRPTIWNTVGQGSTTLAVGAGGGCLDIFFSRLSFLFSFSLSLGEYCLNQLPHLKSSSLPRQVKESTHMDKRNNQW